MLIILILNFINKINIFITDIKNNNFEKLTNTLIAVWTFKTK